jgi:monoamine oxidase
MRARTPLLRVLQGISRDYAAAEQMGCTVQEVQAERREARAKGLFTRREVLGSGALGAASAVVGPALLRGHSQPAAATTTPRIAIVGAGIAGLNAALTLQDGTSKVPPYASTVFEAQDYIGGRMHSDTTSWADGQVSEWCGELIDSDHTTIMSLAVRFNLSLTDLLAAQPAGSTDLYYLFGKYYPYSQAVTDFAPVYATLQDQINAAGYPTLYNSYNTAGYDLDHMSNSQWIENYVPGGLASNMGALLNSAYLTEYGLDSSLQSSLNIVYLLGYQPTGPITFSIFGTSDERYHITGGNQQLPKAIAGLITTRAPACTINLSTKMTAIARNADATYTLTFTGPSGTFSQVFDQVILTMPFTVLRGLTFSAAGFSAKKTYAIDNLGYGTNSKLQLQFSSRYWNLSGQPWGIANDGSTYVDTDFQGGWDVTRGQAGKTGIMVRYAGGTIGTSFTEDDPASLDTYAKQTLSLLEAFFPGITPYYNGIVTLSTPWRNPDLLGSYSCWKVGQYTSVAGLERLRQGNCHFAGEMCSINFQGFMEGGAEEGARAAQEIQSDLSGLSR